MVEAPSKPVNTGKSLLFRDFVQYLLQPLQDYTRRPGTRGKPGVVAPAELKRAAIAKFITRWRKEVGNDVFPIFRLLMPERDKERSMYKIKEANMAKLFIKILGISPASEDAISIEKWKIPGPRGAAGDFPGRLYEVLRARAAISEWGDMSIDEVNEGLDQLSRCSKESQQRPIIANFYNRMSAQELRWLCCIILRVMKIGATERTIFDIWHPDAAKLFNKSSSLSRVCWELYVSDYRLPDAEKDISVFSCFQPQLAAFKKDDIASVVKKMGGKTFYIEEKLDGERIQLHKDGHQFKYWSRKAKDYTYLYGQSYGDASNQEGGGLTKYLQDAFSRNVRTLVLDGEMITWNDKFDAPVGFGSLKSAATAEMNNTNTSFDGHPFYCVFDILYLNGQSLTNYTLRERRKALLKVIKPVTRRIEVVPVQEATKDFEVESRLRECIATASEGLVVKDPDTAYIPNDRNDSWIKVKPEYMEEFGENLDLLVLGGYWGEGRRGNRLAAFICGLRENNPDGDEPIPRFKTFARVGGGFNGPDYAQINHITDGRWHKFDRKNPPEEYYEFAKNSSGQALEAPDMWIKPEDSFVVQLKAASAAASDQFATRVTLRFPRFERLREDKDWKTATSLNEFIQLQAQADHEKQEKVMNAHVRRKKATTRTKKEMTIAGNDTIKVDRSKLTKLFDGLDMYIMTESKESERTKIELETLAKESGANLVFHEGTPHSTLSASDSTMPSSDQHKSRKRKLDQLGSPEPATSAEDKQNRTIIVAERRTVKVASLMKQGTYDIVKPSWLLQSVAHGRVLELEPRFVFFATPATRAQLDSQVDADGDSFLNAIDPDELRSLLDGMVLDEATIDESFETEIRALKAEIASSVDDGKGLPLWLFSRFVAYFDRRPPETDADDGDRGKTHTALLWQTCGGRIASDVHDAEITHVVIDPADLERVKRIRTILSMRDGRVPRVVQTRWVVESFEAQTILSEDKYSIRKT